LDIEQPGSQVMVCARHVSATNSAYVIVYYENMNLHHHNLRCYTECKHQLHQSTVTTQKLSAKQTN